jgi:Cu2+-exporting ATPase
LAIAATLLAVSALGHWDHLGGPTLPILSTVEFHALLATLAIAIPGREILLDGLAGLWRRIPTMNSLIALGTLTAYGTSLVALFVPRLGWECFFDEPVMLLGFILLGRTLEARARSQARSSFEALLALKPAQARVLPRGDRPPASALELTAQNMPVEQVAIGQWLQVLPGDQIPVDGEVICGQTTVDESMLTGEALPVLKQPGDTVSAGTLVQSGAIALQATRVGQDTAIARIIRMVEDAQARKAPIQRLADTVAGYFTYGVMAIAALTFLFWYGFGVQAFPEVLTVGGDPAALHHQHLAFQNLAFAHAPWGHPATHPSVTALLLSLKLAIAVLVVACPCALGLATPTALLVGSSLGAERGLLLRGGDILERLHQVTTIVFDKTGTLTTGTPTVETVEVFPAVGTSPDLGANQPPDLTPETLLRWAAAVESGTQHPLAIAIRQAAHDLDLPPAHNFHTAPGLGASAVIAGDRIALGNLAWLAQLGVAIPATTPASSPSTAPDAAPDAAQTVVYVAQGDRLVGTIGVRDRLVPNASATVQQLQHMGLTVRVLTGDRPAAAQALAQDLGLDPAAVIADLRPEHKADYLQQWRDRGEVVAMVGDGINDAPALASADVGIAVGSATDVAVETAGIVLIRGQLGDLLDAIHLGRATFRKIRQNLAWAMTYNAIGIPIAAGVLLPSWGLLLSPAIAAAMMAFSSVSVVANSLLLRRVLTVSNLP